MMCVTLSFTCWLQLSIPFLIAKPFWVISMEAAAMNGEFMNKPLYVKSNLNQTSIQYVIFPGCTTSIYMKKSLASSTGIMNYHFSYFLWTWGVGQEPVCPIPWPLQLFFRASPQKCSTTDEAAAHGLQNGSIPQNFRWEKKCGPIDSDGLKIVKVFKVHVLPVLQTRFKFKKNSSPVRRWWIGKLEPNRSLWYVDFSLWKNRHADCFCPRRLPKSHVEGPANTEGKVPVLNIHKNWMHQKNGLKLI